MVRGKRQNDVGFGVFGMVGLREMDHFGPNLVDQLGYEPRLMMMRDDKKRILYKIVKICSRFQLNIVLNNWS